ncbi:Intraflagellar transport protein 74 homolog [Caenorhabditis elegans]|uniref:Intraflagellar transport protein 74 homolog n=1 Tax=Caenorhabditis elegans TaxID=6239 RepID=A0A2C9C2L6_CAEEL|nr:Intraflagellar transport protein 74 homolog [Caenorhabditis elegans]SOF58739.1 Intraflagellar transport protein 74 homolog [Caenorhabditis elegans]|eukprot:NP_495359.2 IFT (Chlamydomonas IntraFlagellar Transport) homolog [Caenorhabditis elegans]
MERPSTASSRPRTSTGRAPSARARPPSAMRAPPPQPTYENRPTTGMSMRNGGPPVPPSRSGMIPVPPSRSGGPPAPMPVSRAGGPPRAPTSMGGRPMTGMARPPTAGLRPVTQQGLRAPPSRMGTGNSRQVFDKSYYIGVLRAKQNAIKVEISRMKEKRDKGIKDRNELHAYESRASAQAQEISDLQGKLLDLNKIMEKIHLNGDMSDIELEASKMKEQADEMRSLAEEVFNERRAKEEELQGLEIEVEEQKKLNEAVTHAMDPQMKEKYEDLKSEAKLLRERVVEMEAKNEDLDDRISKYEIEIRSNPLKKKAIQLQETLDTLKKQEEKLMEDMQSALTPEAWRDKMSENMKQLNADLVVIEKQHKTVKDQISLASEELHEYDSQGEAQIMAHHTKYLDLLSKSTMLDDTTENYPQQIVIYQQDIEEFSDAVVLILRKISANLKKVNLEDQITDLDERGLTLQTGNVDELKEMHVRLQEELISIEDMELALNEEIDNLETEEKKIDQELAGVGKNVDSDGLRQELEERQKRLEDEAPARSHEMQQLEANVASIRNELHSIPGYSQHKMLRERLEAVEKRTAAKSLDMSLRKTEIDYEDIKTESIRLQEEYNNMLLTNPFQRFT